MFDVSLYTDVRADEAIDGVAGFNFIAASSGVDATDRKYVAQRMLHAVKMSWHVDHSDELAHPPSCIYRMDAGRHYLSRGRSTGQTVTAPRPGNQITQTIVSRDADDFVPYRPAQLYAARKWQLSRDVVGKAIPPWPTPLEIDPAFEPEELNDALVSESPFGVDFLPQFLTMVEEAVAMPSKKLIIVHTDLDLVMRYISLASLFLDADRALAMSFVAFAEQPLAVDGDIVGATPDFGATPSADSGSAAYNVVDLLAVQMSPVTVSRSAACQAAWFAADPVGALAAIDVARRWEQALGADVATDAAAIVNFTDRVSASNHDRTAALRAVAGLATGSLGDDLAMYAEELLDAVVSSPPACDDDVMLAGEAIGASRQVGIDEVGAGVLLPTLEALSSRPDLIAAWCNAIDRWPSDLATLRWDSEDSRGHAIQVQAEVVARANAEDLVAVLLGAKSTGILPDEDKIASALDRLSDFWSEHPQLSNRKDGLPFQPTLERRLTSKIVTALERGDAHVVEALIAGQWDWLSDQSSALAPWISAVRVGSLSFERRADEIAVRGAQLPDQSWRIALAGIDMRKGAPTVAAWLNTRSEVPTDLGEWILSRLTDSASQYDDGLAARCVVSAMLKRRLRTDHTGLRQFLADADRIVGLYQEARRRVGDQRNPAAHDFAAKVARRVAFFTVEVGTLLVKCSDQQAVQSLERAAGEWAAVVIEDALVQVAQGHGDVEAIEWALSLYESGTDVQRDAATEFLLALVDSRSGRQRLEDAREGISRSWVPVLEKLMEESKRGRLSRNLMRGSKRLFGKER